MQPRHLAKTLSLILMLSSGALYAASAQPDMTGVTSPQPGLWSIATQGTVHVMGYTEPFSKTLKRCVHAGQEAKALLPPDKGQCDRQETTVDGVMHWQLHCSAGGTTADTACAIETAKRHYSVKCTTEVNDPPSTTAYTAKARWLQASCQ